MSQPTQCDSQAVGAGRRRSHNRGGLLSQRAQSQGPRVPSPNIYNTLPDLRFLNHNKKPVTVDSLLDPMSTNSAGKQQFQAMREAEAWYTATYALLKERLELCEKLKTGLGEVNKMLSHLEQDRERAIQIDGHGKGAETKLQAEPVQIGKDGPAIATASENSGQAKVPASSIGGATAAGPSSPLKSVRVKKFECAKADLEFLKGAIETWLKDIRVSRAKWIAGGRDFERKIGLRWT